MIFLCDNDVIQNGDSNDLASMCKLPRRCDIFGGRVEDARRVIVSKDYGGCPIGDGIHKNLPRVHLAFVEKTNRHHPISDHLVCSIQGYAEEVLLLLLGNVCNKGQDVFCLVDNDAFP